MLELDLVAPFLCAQRAARRMVAAGHGGQIVNVTDWWHVVDGGLLLMAAAANQRLS